MRPLVYYNRRRIGDAVRSVLRDDVARTRFASGTDTIAALLCIGTKSAEPGGSWVLDFIDCLQELLVVFGQGPLRKRFGWALHVYLRALSDIVDGRLRCSTETPASELVAEAGQNLRNAAYEFRSLVALR